MNAFAGLAVLCTCALAQVDIAAPDDEAAPLWIVEPLPEQLVDLMSGRGVSYGSSLAFDLVRHGTVVFARDRVVLFSPDGTERNATRAPGWPVVDQDRRIVGFASETRIWPVRNALKVGEPFPTVRRWHVRAFRSATETTFFVRWGSPGPPMRRSDAPAHAGFTLYDQKGNVVMERDDDSGMHFRELLDGAVVVATPDDKHHSFRLITFDGRERAAFGELSVGSTGSVLVRPVRGEYVAVETLGARADDSDTRRIRPLDVYAKSGKRVLRLEDSEFAAWDCRGHYLVGANVTHRAITFVIYDLRNGQRVGVSEPIVLPADVVGVMKYGEFASGERLVTLQLKERELHDGREVAVYSTVALVVDMTTGSVLWKGAPQRYSTGDEEAKDYRAVSPFIAERVPGEVDALFIFDEDRGPSLIRRAAAEDK